MPDVTTTEFVVTGYVNERFEGVHWERETHPTGTYYTFSTAPYERWVDTDGDGWFDYGTRNEGYGHWSRFDGFAWRDSNGKVIPKAPEENQLYDSVSRFDQSQDVIVDTSVNDWFF